MVGKDRYCEITAGEAHRMVCAQEIMVDIRTREEVFGAIETAKGWLSPRG